MGYSPLDRKESDTAGFTHTHTHIYNCVCIYILFTYIYTDTNLHRYTHTLFQTLFHSRLLNDIEYSSLCCTVDPYYFINPVLLNCPFPSFPLC